MKKLFSVAAIAALILSVSACGKKDAKAEEAAEQNVVNVDLQGSYKLVSLAVNDSTSYAPVNDTIEMITFNFMPDSVDNTFAVLTPTNSFNGTYVLIGDSISFQNIAATDSLFEEKNPENYVFALLNGANTVVVENDSIVYINSSALDPSANIQLQKIQ